MYVAKTTVQEWTEVVGPRGPAPREACRALTEVEKAFTVFEAQAEHFTLDQALVFGWTVYRRSVADRRALTFDETLHDHALALDREEHAELSEFLGTGKVTQRYPAKTVRDLARTFLTKGHDNEETK